MKADMNIPGGGLPPFWQISENPAPGLGWSKFGPVHWIWLAAGAAAIAALLFLYKRLGDKGRRIMAWTIVVLQLLNEVDTQAMLIATGQWNVSDLPLHLCSLTEFIFLAHVIRPKSRPLSARGGVRTRAADMERAARMELCGDTQFRIPLRHGAIYIYAVYRRLPSEARRS